MAKPIIAMACVLAALVLPAKAEQNKSVAEQTIAHLNRLSGGPHSGMRANHAKGLLVSGSFTPSAGAAAISIAPHFKETVPVIVRFSTGTGLPVIADGNPNSRPYGMAIRYTLPQGGVTDFVGISYDGFPVSTPEDFLGLLNALGSTEKSIDSFLASHPAALAFVRAPKPAPVSFGSQSYFGVHAFEFTNANGESRFGRYRIVPLNGNEFLSEAEAAKRSNDYLIEELPLRLAQGEVKFKLVLQLAEKGDVTNDASIAWPKERAVIELGTLTLSKPVANSRQQEKTLAFNPLILPDGIAPSSDPVLLARPIVYAISVGRRN
jgi:catalase